MESGDSFIRCHVTREQRCTAYYMIAKNLGHPTFEIPVINLRQESENITGKAGEQMVLLQMHPKYCC